MYSESDGQVTLTMSREDVKGAHCKLCERATQWLRGSQRCDPVLYGIASTEEIPDVIGWNSNGSTVVECKVSVQDLLREKSKRHAEKRMGDYRFFMCPMGMVDSCYIDKYFPDHGLLCPQGRRMLMLRQAPFRDSANHRSEIRYLRFALIHVRSNLLKIGCSVDLPALCQFLGEDGIALPAETRPFYRQQPQVDLVKPNRLNSGNPDSVTLASD